MKLGDSPLVQVGSVSTGSISLDKALGIGGLPKGRITEIYGAEASGKTTLALHVVAESQKQGGVCAYIDAENALDPLYAKRLGVDVDNLLISQPDTGEQALEITDMLIKRRRRGHGGDRFRGGAGAQSGAGRRHGRRAHGFTGTAHEPGAPQTFREHQPIPCLCHIYQSGKGEDRSDVRESDNDTRRAGA